MGSAARHPRYRPIALAAGLLLAAALACNAGSAGGLAGPIPTATLDLAATSASLQGTADALAQIQTQAAQIPPTTVQLPTAAVTAGPTPTAANAAGLTVNDDFSADHGNFELRPGESIRDGELYLGPYDDCGDLQANSQFGCFAVCTACGVPSNYEMSADVRYADGVSERTYGLVVQFDDVNGNSQVDVDDYYLEYQISAFTAFYTDNLYLREHVPGAAVGATGFNFVRRWDTRDLTHDTYGVNRLRVVASGNGIAFDLYLNDNFVDSVAFTGQQSAKGKVGLSVSGRAVQVAFDNFTFASQ